MSQMYNNTNYFSGAQQHPIMFPQPDGNVYLINNSLEVANIPAGAGITAALCTSENLLYLKTMQNGIPTFLAYQLTPYNEMPKANQATNKNDINARLDGIEKQVQGIVELISKGVKKNDEPTTANANANAATNANTNTTSSWG